MRSSALRPTATRVFFRGDAVSGEHSVHGAVADLEPGLRFQQAGMFFQGGVRILLQLLEEDLFVFRLDRPSTSTG